ncbi:hypothetical protein AYM39_09215 [Methylomonas sp. DH-1]|nr:hypothetical protein AYM39_09215 [Methylomonas sp. DH-1]
MFEQIPLAPFCKGGKRFFKAMFALIVGVAPAWIAGAQKPRMAEFQHILVPWIPAIHLCPLGMPG